jgi:hypothetical protein
MPDTHGLQQVLEMCLADAHPESAFLQAALLLHADCLIDIPLSLVLAETDL